MAKQYALIMGANLRNKGAQAMCFISVSEIRKRFPDLEPVLLSDITAKTCRKKGAPADGSDGLTFDISCIYPTKTTSAVKDIAKWFYRKRERETADPYYQNAALCIDVSGFVFGDKWGFERCWSYLQRLNKLVGEGVPVYLMPQSFGPFNFEKSQFETLKSLANEVLPKTRLIFARETDGLERLKALCPEAPIVKSNDLVLQNSTLDLNSIFISTPTPCKHLPSKANHWVGVVPNSRNYDKGGNSEILDSLYKTIIKKLLQMGYNVAIIRHANDDFEICNSLKALFEHESRVEIFDEDRYCFEYENLFSQCDFLIASRFHSIVHAYKCGIPCIALGWAVKYQELLDAFGQGSLAFDVTASDFDPSSVENAIDDVSRSRELLKSQITATVEKIQSNNVFDDVEKDFKMLSGTHEK